MIEKQYIPRTIQDDIDDYNRMQTHAYERRSDLMRRYAHSRNPERRKLLGRIVARLDHEIYAYGIYIDTLCEQAENG